MNITELRVNGIHNPIGFSYPWVKISWKVEDFTDKKQENACIEIAMDSDFSQIIAQKEGKELQSIGERVDINLKPYTRYYYRVTITGNQGEKATSIFGQAVETDNYFFETGKMNEAWVADFISTEKEDTFHPVFRKKFYVEDIENIRQAKIYVTGLGLYEAYLNGIKIGDDLLAPFCNDYHQAIQYQIYDLLPLLKEENILEIMTGNGWYKGHFGLEGREEIYGNRFAAIAEVYVTGKEGIRLAAKTDSSWTYRGSDIAMSDIYNGEEYNHLLWDGRNNDFRKVIVLSESAETNASFEENIPLKSKLVERYSIPVLVKDEVKVKEIIYTPAGETVLDMGQNFTGYIQFVSKMAKGTKIVLDFGEILQQGNFYNKNYRTAKSQFIYVSDGREEVVRPHFTYFGFRYVRVTGWKGEINSDDFVGKVVYSDLAAISKFECSSPMLNQLASNCMWGQRSNFLDMPTDCPQRDERLGWTGDAQVFAPTANFNMDTRAFYRKFLYDLRLEQGRLNGAIPHYIPNGSAIHGSSIWGDAATFIPMSLYHYYGDRDELKANYPMMKDWVEFIIRGDEEHGNRHLWNFGFHFGDWLAQDGVSPQSMKGGTEDCFVASAYYYASVKKLAEAAGILGYAEDEKKYQKKAQEVYQAFIDEYFSRNGRLAIDTQTAYILCLQFGIYEDKERVIEGFKNRLKKDMYKIKGGFVGATMMCQVLAENKMEDIAYYMLFQEGFPGWMYCINLGATTIWERWNSVLDDGTISGTEMNSLNHYSYGAVMEFVYRYIAGISETSPGFQTVRFAPRLNPKLSSVNYSYDSVSGKYTSNWKINEDGTVTVHFEVPFNCTANVVLPGSRADDNTEINIEAGIFEKTYQPEKDFRCPYNMETRLVELKEDERAMELLKTNLPNACEIIQSGNLEFMNMSFAELQFLSFRGFNPKLVQDGTRELFMLRVV